MRFVRLKVLHAAIVGLLAVVSLACRLPYLSQPFQSGHDTVNFHTLQIAAIWDAAGLTGN